MIQTMVPDWGRIISDLAGAGHSSRDLSRVMQSQVTDRMIRWYGDGMQPTYWRGKLLIECWCSVLRRSVSDVPLTALRPGYRAQGSYTGDQGPKVQALPKWPPAVPVAVAPVKRRKREAA